MFRSQAGYLLGCPCFFTLPSSGSSIPVLVSSLCAPGYTRLVTRNAQRLRQAGGGSLSVSNRSSDGRAPSTARLSLARYLGTSGISARPLQTIPPIRQPMAGQPSLFLTHCWAACSLARTCTSMDVPCPCTCTCTSHCRRFSCFITAPFLANLAFLALSCLASRDSAPPFPMTVSDLTSHLPYPPGQKDSPRVRMALSWPQ